jgi:hypothetical protein
MKKLFLHPLAVEEILEAKNFYNSKVNGLGNHLFEEIDRAIKLIEETPVTWPTISKYLHRFILKKFPFAVIYRIKEDSIQVIAFMHQHRKPFYWKKRIN